MRIRDLTLVLVLVLCLALTASAQIIPNPGLTQLGYASLQLAGTAVTQAEVTGEDVPMDEEGALYIETDNSSPTLIDTLYDMWSKTDARMMALYNFDKDIVCLGANAAYPLHTWGNVTLNVDALLISDEGLSFGLGPGLTIKQAVSLLDITAAWSPQVGWVAGIGISKNF